MPGPGGAPPPEPDAAWRGRSSAAAGGGGGGLERRRRVAGGGDGPGERAGRPLRPVPEPCPGSAGAASGEGRPPATRRARSPLESELRRPRRPARPGEAVA